MVLSPDPPTNRLRPHASSLRQVLTDSAPPPLVSAARALLQRSPTAVPHKQAYATALVIACQWLWAAPNVAQLWRMVADEAVALIGADGAAVVAYTDRCWHILAANPGDAAGDDSAAAEALETLFQRGLLRQPISIDDLAEDGLRDGLGWRTLLVERIEGSPRQSVRLVWYATRPATLSPYTDAAEAFAQLASLALAAVTERDNLNRAVAARHRVGLAQGILMTRRHVTADQAFALLRRRSQNTNVKLREIAETVIETGDLPVDASDAR